MEAERLGGPAFAEVMAEMRDGQRTMAAQLDTLIKGFPDGDTEAHRRYHEAIIERIELRNKIIREALVKVAGSSFLAGAMWLAYAVWQAIAANVRQGG